MGFQISPTANDEALALCLAMLASRAEIRPGREPTTRLSFKCSVCSKTFSSYQALGGHKSSHRRPPAVLGLELMLRPLPVSSGSESSGSGGAHQCNVCYRSFATGQALGGHKRCHYWDSSSSYSSSVGGVVRDFDLNLPAVAAEEFWGVEEGEEVQSPHPSAKKKIRLL